MIRLDVHIDEGPFSEEEMRDILVALLEGVLGLTPQQTSITSEIYLHGLRLVDS